MSGVTYNPAAHLYSINEKTDFKELRVKAGDVHACFELGYLYYIQGHMKDAYPFLFATHKLYPDDKKVASLYAKCCMELGRKDEVANIRKDLLEDDSNKNPILEMLNVIDYSFSQRPVRHLAYILFVYFGIMSFITSARGLLWIPILVGVAYALQKGVRYIKIDEVKNEGHKIKIEKDPYKWDRDMGHLSFRTVGFDFSAYLDYRMYEKHIPKEELSQDDMYQIQKEYESLRGCHYMAMSEVVNCHRRNRCEHLKKRYLAGEEYVLPVLQYIHNVDYKNGAFVEGVPGAIEIWQ